MVVSRGAWAKEEDEEMMMMMPRLFLPLPRLVFFFLLLSTRFGNHEFAPKRFWQKRMPRHKIISKKNTYKEVHKLPPKNLAFRLSG